MLPTNSHNDPIVEILRLAYRRGIAIQQEQAKKTSTAATVQTLDEDELKAELKDFDSGKESKQERGKG